MGNYLERGQMENSGKGIPMFGGFLLYITLWIESSNAVITDDGAEAPIPCHRKLASLYREITETAV